MLRKFALLLALGALSSPLVGCNQEAMDDVTPAPATTPDTELDADADADVDDLGSDEAMDDSNATTGN